MRPQYSVKQASRMNRDFTVEGTKVIASYFSTKMLRMHVEFVVVSHFELLELGATL